MAKNKVVYVNPDGIKEALELLIDERDRYKEALEKILSVVGVGTTAARIASDALDGDDYSHDWDADANAPIEDGCVPTHWMPVPEPPK